uniref:Reverse transcriptase domain-containing protein n=1 Tax=Tanacetum cinerariifolium TaxID=118510 RepID=A0A6L2N7H7_TANCI|nr:reverse transcriptase domain-containing protein [Tanacetum cinerariifolium]
MEEMMITTTAFIRGEVAAASKKKGHASWKARDQSKWQNSDKRFDFQGHSRERRGSNRFTLLQGRRKRFLRPKQRQDYMVAGTTKAPSDHRRHQSFYKSMDEFHDCKVVVTLQRRRRDVTIYSTVLIPTECTSMITSSAVSREKRTCPVNFKVALHPDFLDQESVVEHRLNIQEGYSPVRQKKKGQAPERDKAIQAEVQKLVEARIMREVYYYDWLSNIVMVKKHDGSWWMCVNFTDLNKACPQDCYPLSEIDWKVESLCGYPFKCFLDAYKGYHQIQLAEPDEEKTAFHTRQWVYYYMKMPFVLKNAGATYQRLMDKAFESQIGRNIEVYVDDLVVKSYTEAEMIRDIEETFRILRKVNMKLNLKKCLFGLAERIFLGYVVTPEGRRPCPDKTAVVLQLPSSRTIKEVQSLNGKLASLNRFLSKSAEMSLPLFQTLKKGIKKSDFHWTAEAEQAFKQLK